MSNQTQVIIYGTNYTGANARGIKDACDDVDFKLQIVGDEQLIINFILDNLFYGTSDIVRPHEIKDLAMCLGRDTYKLPQFFDGCGAVAAIVQNDQVIVDVTNQYYDGDTFNDIEWLDIGSITMDSTKDQSDVLIQMIQMIQDKV